MIDRFIDRYDVIFLDQGRTFMFANDRFGPMEDYFATYRGLGGAHLSSERLHGMMSGLVRRLSELGRDPGWYDSFPSVSEALRDLPEGRFLDAEEARLIDELVALHEVGSISLRHADAIRRMAATHRLGVISNIWARKEVFERNLANAGILGCFEHIVWSSETRCIKPSPKSFRRAFDLFGIEPARALLVGDHPLRDIAGAKNCGCAAAWVRNGNEEFPRDYPAPDLVIADIEQLLDAWRQQGALAPGHP